MFDDSDFCDGDIHERKVVLGDGSEKIVWFKALPNTDWKRYYMWLRSESEDTRASAEARLVVLGVCNPDGSPALSLDQAKRLKVTVLGRLITALQEVNGGQSNPVITLDENGEVAPPGNE